jgi:hypothetical protein
MKTLAAKVLLRHFGVSFAGRQLRIGDAWRLGLSHCGKLETGNHQTSGQKGLHCRASRCSSWPKGMRRRVPMKITKGKIIQQLSQLKIFNFASEGDFSLVFAGIGVRSGMCFFANVSDCWPFLCYIQWLVRLLSHPSSTPLPGAGPQSRCAARLKGSNLTRFRLLVGYTVHTIGRSLLNFIQISCCDYCHV